MTEKFKHKHQHADKAGLQGLFSPCLTKLGITPYSYVRSTLPTRSFWSRFSLSLAPRFFLFYIAIKEKEMGQKGLGKKQFAAFTLAEVLITLAIIGIVAALTIPALVQNHNEHVWKTAKNLLEKKLVETTRRMNIDGVMTGYNTTEAYFDTFRKYMKIVKSCEKNDINKCYAPKVITTGKDGEIEVDTKDLKTAKNLSLDFNTNTMAFVIADGTTVIMAYNPNCETVDPISKEGQAGQVGCMGMVIDVNGKKGPNRVGKDIQLSSGVAFSTCDNPIGDLCFSTDFAANKAINTCDDTTYDESGSANSNCATNYWAGAKQTCAEKGMRLPTRAELAQLASTIYGTEIGEKENKDGLSIQQGYENALSFNGYYYWSSEQLESNANCAYYRRFSNTFTNGNDTYWDGKNYSRIWAVCLGSER